MVALRDAGDRILVEVEGLSVGFRSHVLRLGGELVMASFACGEVAPSVQDVQADVRVLFRFDDRRDVAEFALGPLKDGITGGETCVGLGVSVAVGIEGGGVLGRGTADIEVPAAVTGAAVGEVAHFPSRGGFTGANVGVGAGEAQGREENGEKRGGELHGGNYELSIMNDHGN